MMNTRKDLGLYTIAEVEERTGLSAALLRQWERRYGFPKPERSPGGHRLYSAADLEALQTIKGWIQNGASPSQAVRRYLESLNPEGPRPTHLLSRELEATLLKADLEAAERVLAEAYRLYPLELVVMEVVSPCLIRIGDGWHQGHVNTAQEHLASTYLRGRLHELLNLMGGSLGPTVVVTTIPGEQHEIGALVSALFLRRAGYNVHYLGTNTPLVDLKAFCDRTQAKAAVISAMQKSSLLALPPQALKGIAPVVVLGGRAVQHKPELAEALGARYLGNDPTQLAEALAGVLKEAAIW
jgi:DNA-binding transcriptional MerR regulator/methylmalonyl-CoA mutase cobalamin-binding subunit